MSLSRLSCRGALFLAISFLAACAGQSTSLTPSFSTSATNALVQVASVPPDCKRQKTTSQYATLIETLSTKGGYKLCIPAFGGLGGSIQYSSVQTSVKMTVTSSTANYNKLPKLSTGKPVFYLQIALSSGTVFGTNLPMGGGLTGKPIVAGNTYTAYIQFKYPGITVDLTPCYAVATKGTYGGVIGGLGSLLRGQSVPFAFSGVLEIYPGKGKGVTINC